jgi:hypothetical protein
LTHAETAPRLAIGAWSCSATFASTFVVPVLRSASNAWADSVGTFSSRLLALEADPAQLAVVEHGLELDAGVVGQHGAARRRGVARRDLQPGCARQRGRRRVGGGEQAGRGEPLRARGVGEPHPGELEPGRSSAAIAFAS